MSEQTYEYYAGMSCDGCKSAITRILSKTEGVTTFDINVATKQVLVTGTISQEEVFAKLNKWATAAGKELRLITH